jgi:lipopolysaccharide transport system permease protein
LILAAFNVQFRDVKYAIPFFVQMGLFVTPVVYSLGDVPERFHLLMGLNPMAGMLDGFRHAVLGTPARWEIIGLSAAVSAGVFVAGLYVFRRAERRFADVI